MGTFEFISLPLNQRAELVSDIGTFISSYRGKLFSYSLYSLDGFYVEVTVDNEKNRIEEVTPFMRGYRLNKYADKIDLSKLIG
jgi:hypothetical protein